MSAFGVEVVAPRDQTPVTEEVTKDEDINTAFLDEYAGTLEVQLQIAEESTEELRRDLAVRDLALDCERIHRMIFGSQIAALRAAAAVDPLPMPESTLRQRFDEAKSKWSVAHKDRTFAPWIGFLIGSGLIEIVPTGYRITSKGRAYLSYIDSLGLPPRLF
jgi:hypothetical protein